MHSTELPNRLAPAKRQSSVAFLYLLVGGTGQAAYEVFRKLARTQTACWRSLLLDPDPESRSQSHADQIPELNFHSQIANMVQANAKLFGDFVGLIFDELQNKLSPDDVGHGMRTTRPLTQIWFAYHYDTIVAEIRRAIDQLRGPHTILPVIVSSAGGGTGSALTVLLLEAFCDARFRRQILLGMPEAVLACRPIVFVADPFAYAREAPELKRRKILGNMFAFRDEVEQLLKRSAAQYVYHIGFSNCRTAITTGDMMARVLGTALYVYQSCYDVLKARHVDHPDDVAMNVRYCGLDFVRKLRHASPPSTAPEN